MFPSPASIPNIFRKTYVICNPGMSCTSKFFFEKYVFDFLVPYRIPYRPKTASSGKKKKKKTEVHASKQPKINIFAKAKKQ